MKIFFEIKLRELYFTGILIIVNFQNFIQSRYLNMKNITSLHAIEIHSNPYARCDEWFVILRDGRKAQFDHSKIIQALYKAGAGTGEFNQEVAEDISLQVVGALGSYGEHSFGLESIQDTIEEVLLRSPYKKTAKAYILYREKRLSCGNLRHQTKWI